MRVAATTVLVTLAVLGTSCASGGDDADQSAPAPERPVEQPADAESVVEADPATADTVVEVDPDAVEPAVEVQLGDFSFRPATVEVAVGDTVRWTNSDATLHTVTAGADAEPTGAFHLTLDGAGASAALEFTEPGEYRYFCTPHPFMQGTVSVSG